MLAHGATLYTAVRPTPSANAFLWLPSHPPPVVISELASSKLLQMKVRNLIDFAALDEELTRDNDGFEVRTYVPAFGAEDDEFQYGGRRRGRAV